MKEVYMLACDQGVQAIAWDGLQNLLSAASTSATSPASSASTTSASTTTSSAASAPAPFIDTLLPRELKLRWALSVEKISQRYFAQKKALAKLVQFYSENGIRTMLLKGYGLSLAYPIPEHRPCGDIDIWLFGEQKRADKLLSESYGINIDWEHHLHTVFNFEGVMVENHFNFLNSHSHLSNRTIDKQLLCFVAAFVQEIELDGQKLYLPSPDFNALYLLRHAASHFAAVEIKLRHILDWLAFVQKDGRKVNWTKIESIAREQNMDRFLHCLNGICIDCFGMDSSLVPSFKKDEKLQERVLLNILDMQGSLPISKESGLLRRIFQKLQRWWSNRWKHHLVYKEGLLTTFFVQIYSHLLKPKSLRL